MREKDPIMSSLSVKYNVANQAIKNAKTEMDMRWRTQAGAVAQQNSLWQEMQNSHKQMNDEYNKMQAVYDRNQSYWNEYGKVRDRNNSEIERLKRQADLAHQNMSNAYDRASSAYNYGNKADAPGYAEEGKRYKLERDELHSRIKDLGREVKSAKAYAQNHTNSNDNSVFKKSKHEFEEARRRFNDSKQKTQIAKDKFAKSKKVFEESKSKLALIKNQQSERIKELKAETKKSRTNERALAEKAGVPFEYLSNVKVRREANGEVNFYFGGFDKSDGLFHGHISMSADGEVSYIRMPLENHGSQNYTKNEKDGWGEYIHGSIDGHEVTVRKGFGANEGHTLIADGYKSSRQFGQRDSNGSKKHNHYGPKRENKGYINKDRGYYTGPDH
ncbi:putative nuclear RNA export factor SDE5 [Candidatus Saccharibacteria bacterium]|jgi:hypothetical protein|nr:putative nuclear RNA export factor SDE5 [Candidatus Saccharibacteria bacterium]